MSDREYIGGYRHPYGAYGTKRMVVDEEATKDAVYAELEDMANEMLKLMDQSGIDIFEYSIHSPQRKKGFEIKASTKVTSGRYKREDVKEN